MGLHVEVVFGVRGLVGIGDGERKAVDIESFALFELVFSVDDEVVFVLTVVHLN